LNLKNKFLKIFNSKWCPFGNCNDPIPLEWVFAKYGNIKAYLYWYFIRNPFHNFAHFWLGTGNYPAEWKVWSSKRRWNLVLPFFSYRSKKWEFYAGWRPDSKMFGIALRKIKGGV